MMDAGRRSRMLARIATIRHELDALEREVLAPEAESGRLEYTHVTAADFAQRMKVSTETVRRWVQQGMPVIRVGRMMRIKLADADAWLSRG